MTNLLKPQLNYNYWSPLTCLVEEQEEPKSDSPTTSGPQQNSPAYIETALSAIGRGIPPNKQELHWARKFNIRRLKWVAFLDLGATSGAAPEEVELDLGDT